MKHSSIQHSFIGDAHSLCDYQKNLQTLTIYTFGGYTTNVMYLSLHEKLCNNCSVLIRVLGCALYIYIHTIIQVLQRLLLISQYICIHSLQLYILRRVSLFTSFSFLCHIVLVFGFAYIHSYT